jgi:hypothetical protein
MDMSLGPILRQLEKEKKPLIMAGLFLLGIGIIRLAGSDPKPANIIAFSSNPQAVHMGFLAGQPSAILLGPSIIGIVPPRELRLGPDEESEAYFLAKTSPSVSSENGLLSALSPDFGLSRGEGAGSGLFAKI